METAQLEANKNLVRRLFQDVFNGGDLEAATSLVHADYVQHSPLAAPGISGLIAFVNDLRKAFLDLRMTIEDLVAEGDRVVARMTGEGTHQSESIDHSGSPQGLARSFQVVISMRGVSEITS